MQPQEGDSGCSEDTPFSGCGNLLAVTLTCKGSTGSDQGFGQVGCGLSIQLPPNTAAQVPLTLTARSTGAGSPLLSRPWWQARR